MRGKSTEKEQPSPKKRRTSCDNSALLEGVALADRDSHAQGKPEGAVHRDGGKREHEGHSDEAEETLDGSDKDGSRTGDGVRVDAEASRDAVEEGGQEEAVEDAVEDAVEQGGDEREQEEEGGQGETEDEEEEEEEEEEVGGGHGERGETGHATTAGGVEDGTKIARARSAWMIFLAANRENVRKENPGLAIGPMQKILSEMWKGLDEAETARYAKLAVEDKERMKKELAAAGLTRLPSKKSDTPEALSGGPTSLILPVARVRKTVKLDPAVGNISKEGLSMVTKATEVFMAMLAEKSWHIGRQTGRKSVRPSDVADFVFTAPEMYWLRDEFREERSSMRKNKTEASAKAAAAKKAAMPVAKGAQAITSFFQKQ